MANQELLKEDSSACQARFIVPSISPSLGVSVSRIHDCIPQVREGGEGRKGKKACHNGRMGLAACCGLYIQLVQLF